MSLNTIDFAHIIPTPHLAEMAHLNDCHLILAHLVESDEDYRRFYATLDDGKEKILDNGGFELYKQGRPMYSAEKLIEMGNVVGADIIVLPDYPKQPSQVTIDAAEQWIAPFREAGFGTFFVPQSEVGDLEGYLDSVEWAMDNPDIDVIGLSILGCPIALGLEEQTYDQVDQVDSSYKMQRFLARWMILTELEGRGLLFDDRSLNRFHCLGMVDGPNEVKLLSQFTDVIRSWDSSSAAWLGLHAGRKYDKSPTGLRNGKYEVEVDFAFAQSNPNYIRRAIENIEYINSILDVPGWHPVQ